MRFHVITCWRKNLGDTYLLRTLAQLRRQVAALNEEGVDNHCIYVRVDGDSSAVKRIRDDVEQQVNLCPLPVHTQVVPLGQCGGHTRAWRTLLDQASRHLGSAVFLEDDLLLDSRAAREMVALVPGSSCGFLTFYDGNRLPEKHPDGVVVQPIRGENGHGVWGLIAIKMPCEVVRYLVDADWDSDDVKTFPGYLLHLANWGNALNAADVFTSSLLSRSPWPNYSIHVPSLVQHVGASSECFGPGVGLRGRTARNWRPSAP